MVVEVVVLMVVVFLGVVVDVVVVVMAENRGGDHEDGKMTLSRRGNVEPNLRMSWISTVSPQTLYQHPIMMRRDELIVML